jgi:hypothetical protein
MQETFLDKEKIRTMQKDIKEAEGISVYPKSSVSEEVTQSFIADKEEGLLSLSDLPKPEIEPVPEQGELSVEQETKKAEDLAYELALSTNQSEDNIKEKVLQEETTAPEKTEPAPIAFMDFPKPEETTETPEPAEPEPRVEQIPDLLPIEELTPEPKPEEIEQPIEQVPDLLPIEELTPEPEIKAPEKMPSARELGLEEAEKIPSAEELGLEEAKETAKEAKLIDENEEKLTKIAEATFELEEVLKGINEEKAPFEKRKMEIEDEIENIKKKLDLILEKKNKTDEIKKDLENREGLAQTPEEKRAIEKERWRVEDERNGIEKEKYDKEDEIKSLRLQIRECDLNAEKVLAKEKDTIQQLEIFKRDRDRIILGQTKKDLEERLSPLNQAVEDIKREMFDNTKQRDKSDKGLTDIGLREKAVEDEIKILERRQSETADEVILRDIELRRRTAEEARRKLEKDRWEVEDKIKDLEDKRKIIKEKYQEVSAQIKQIKEELLSIEEKIK